MEVILGGVGIPPAGIGGAGGGGGGGGGGADIRVGEDDGSKKKPYKFSVKKESFCFIKSHNIGILILTFT